MKELFEQTIIKRAKKQWKIKVEPTMTFGNRIYSLIGVGFEEFKRTDLDPKKTEHVEVGFDKEGNKIVATYYFGDDY